MADYTIAKVVKEVTKVTAEQPQVYAKKIMAKDVDGTEYVRRVSHITKEDLLAQKAVIEAQLAEIDKLA